MTLAKPRYRVDLPGLQATCEANYYRLLRLMPQLREPDACRELVLARDGVDFGQMRIDVLEECPYTSVLQITLRSPLSWLPQPRLLVRAYHDARMAEVAGAERLRSLRGVYGYPNQGMHQPDEKAQLNAYLAEWLGQILECGLARDALDLDVSP
nr:DUF1249 domain-containing protein [Atopomonas sediminilitoris]